MSLRCAIHPDMTITHFCETCSDLVCEYCIQKQPHSNSSHIIKQIELAANARKNSYVLFMEQQINPMRSKCQNKIGILHNMKNQVQKWRKVIEKDIKIEFGGIGNRLADRQSAAIIAKQTGMKHLQQYVHAFDDICSAFDSIYENPQAVLMSYKTLDSELKKIQSLQHTLASSIEPNHPLIARQFVATLNKTSCLQHYVDRNSFINKIISSFVKQLQTKKAQTQKSNKQQKKTSENNFNNTLMKAMSDQAAKACAFCGVPFTIDSLNEQCANNRSFKLSCVNNQINWDAVIPENVRGTKNHYWYSSQTSQRKRPMLDQHALIRKSNKKHYWNALIELEPIIYILNKYQIQEGQSFEKVISKNDQTNSGFVSKIAFIYVLSKIYLIPTSQINTLISLLETEKGINYALLNQALTNFTKDYFKFVQSEEEMEKSKPIAPATFSSSYRRY